MNKKKLGLCGFMGMVCLAVSGCIKELETEAELAGAQQDTAEVQEHVSNNTQGIEESPKDTNLVTGPELSENRSENHIPEEKPKRQESESAVVETSWHFDSFVMEIPEFEDTSQVDILNIPDPIETPSEVLNGLLPGHTFSALEGLSPTVEQVVVVRKSQNIEFCEKIDRVLASVSFRNCIGSEMVDSLFRSHYGEPIFYTEFSRLDTRSPLGRVLLIGGVHGDEATSVSSVFSWMSTLRKHHSGMFEWRVAPLVNPDGFFLETPTRTNGNGVDLNRNLPTGNWSKFAKEHWITKTNSLPRKYPGPNAGSEPETQWLVKEIREFKPDVIISVHAPYNLVDFDAANRDIAPRKLGILIGQSLGTFPGSLGRYAGEEKNIPVITIELPHATKMLSKADTRDIWIDLVAWLKSYVNSDKSGNLVQSANSNPKLLN